MPDNCNVPDLFYNLGSPMTVDELGNNEFETCHDIVTLYDKSRICCEVQVKSGSCVSYCVKPIQLDMLANWLKTQSTPRTINLTSGVVSMPLTGPQAPSSGCTKIGVSQDGKLYYPDALSKIEEYDPSTGLATPLTTTASACLSYPQYLGGPATLAQFNGPACCVPLADGSLLVCEIGNYVVTRIVDGIMRQFAGNGNSGTPTPGPATSSPLGNPLDVAEDPVTKAVYICDDGNVCIERVNPVTGILDIPIGVPNSGDLTGDGGPANAATFNSLTSVVVTDKGTVIIADSSSNRIRAVPMAADDVVAGVPIAQGNIDTIAGGGATPLSALTATGIPATQLDLADTGSMFLLLDKQGNLRISANGGNVILTLDLTTGIMTIASGNGTSGQADGPALQATWASPTGMGLGTDGSIWVPAYNGYTSQQLLRKITFDSYTPDSVAYDAPFIVSGTPENVQVSLPQWMKTPPLEASLILDIPFHTDTTNGFNDGDGTIGSCAVLKDFSGNGNDAALTGSTDVKYVPGPDRGAALQFGYTTTDEDGNLQPNSTTYLEIPDSPSQHPDGDWEMDLWLMCPSANGSVEQGLLGKYVLTEDGANGFASDFDSWRVHFNCHLSDGSGVIAYSSEVQPDTWTLITYQFSKSTGTIKVLRNNIDDGTNGTFDPSLELVLPSDPFVIGYSPELGPAPPSEYALTLSGAVARWEWFDRLLTPEERVRLMAGMDLEGTDAEESGNFGQVSIVDTSRDPIKQDTDPTLSLDPESGNLRLSQRDGGNLAGATFQLGNLTITNLPSGTLIAPPASMTAGQLWLDTTGNATYPQLRIVAAEEE